jgi:hypothetical protein
LREHGATTEEIAAAFGYSPSTTRGSVKMLRDWLGTNPRTGVPHIPDAARSSSALTRGIPVYQVDDILVDLDLFNRLAARARAGGPKRTGDLIMALRLVKGRPFSQLRPGGWSWLSDSNVENHTVCAIIDSAHFLTERFLAADDPGRARAATETAMLAAPYDALTKLDLALITKAEGHLEEARRMVYEVCNEPDEDGLPIELNGRVGEVVARMEWFKAS